MFSNNKKGPQNTSVAQVYGRNNTHPIDKTHNSPTNTGSFLSVFAGFCRAALKKPSRFRVVVLAAGIAFATPAYASDATHLVTAEAKRQGVPVAFALKMARIESGVRCHNHNKKSSASGPLQVLRGTARGLGYRGDIRRASCATQTHYGMKHLAMCYRGAKGNQALAKRCHQVGISVLYGKKSKKGRR